LQVSCIKETLMLFFNYFEVLHRKNKRDTINIMYPSVSNFLWSLIFSYI
jgi:hypothetical protein